MEQVEQLNFNDLIDGNKEVVETLKSDRKVVIENQKLKKRIKELETQLNNLLNFIGGIK